MKKYELTNETNLYSNITLYRIKALVDIPRYGVVAGDLGGWIEKEDNLSQDGDAWVCGNAQVYDSARVYGGKWEAAPLYINCGLVQYPFCVSAKDDNDNITHITIGCQTHTLTKWRDNFATIAKTYGITNDEIKIYAQYYNLAASLYGFEPWITQ